MFCYHCGEEIIPGAKFCAKCGTKVIDIGASHRNLQSDISKDMKIEQSDVSKNTKTEQANISEEAEGAKTSQNSRSEEIRDCFMEYFGGRRAYYGSDLNIIGVDYRNDLVDDLLKMEFHYSDDEELLMAFDGSKVYEKGFLLTDRNFYWNDYRNKKNVWPLEKIAGIYFEGPKFISVMHLQSDTGERSGEIHLIGLNKMNDFVSRLDGFFRRINGLDVEEAETEAVQEAKENDAKVDEQRKESESSVKHFEKVVIEDLANKDLCQNLNGENAKKRSQIISSICSQIRSERIITGSPCISRLNPEGEKSRVYLRVPEEENAYLMLDNTTFGSGKSGFIICDSGIYSRLYDKQKNWNWKEFGQVLIKKTFGGGVRIEKAEFILKEDKMAKPLAKILKELQTAVNDNKEIFCKND